MKPLQTLMCTIRVIQGRPEDDFPVATNSVQHNNYYSRRVHHHWLLQHSATSPADNDYGTEHAEKRQHPCHYVQRWSTWWWEHWEDTAILLVNQHLTSYLTFYLSLIVIHPMKQPHRYKPWMMSPSIGSVVFLSSPKYTPHSHGRPWDSTSCSMTSELQQSSGSETGYLINTAISSIYLQKCSTPYCLPNEMVVSSLFKVALHQ